MKFYAIALIAVLAATSAAMAQEAQEPTYAQGTHVPLGGILHSYTSPYSDSYNNRGYRSDHEEQCASNPDYVMGGNCR